VPEKPDAYKERLAPGIMALGPAGTPTDPQRFDAMELAEREVEYGRAGFRLQFMLDTSASDKLRHPLKLHDLIIMPTDVETFPNKVVWAGDPDHTIEYLPRVGLSGDSFQKPMHVENSWSPYTSSVLYVDPSGRGKDEVGYAVVKQIHGMLVVRRWGGLKGGYDEQTLVKIALIAWDEKVNRIVAEDNFGDGMWTALFKPVVRRIWDEKRGIARKQALTPEEMDKAAQLPDGVRVEDHKVGILQKEVRVIEALESVMGSHRLILDEALVKAMCAPKLDSLDHEAALKNGLHQMTRISRDRGCLKYDDQIDALAGAVKQFTDTMAQSVDEAVKEAAAEKLDEELESFMEGVTGQKPHKRTWGNPARR
jgi:hypothetical protein